MAKQLRLYIMLAFAAPNTEITVTNRATSRVITVEVEGEATYDMVIPRTATIQVEEVDPA